VHVCEGNVLVDAKKSVDPATRTPTITMIRSLAVAVLALSVASSTRITRTKAAAAAIPRRESVDVFRVAAGALHLA
jgi:hypothetical protein